MADVSLVYWLTCWTNCDSSIFLNMVGTLVFDVIFDIFGLACSSKFDGLWWISWDSLGVHPNCLAAGRSVSLVGQSAPDGRNCGGTALDRIRGGTTSEVYIYHHLPFSALPVVWKILKNPSFTFIYFLIILHINLHYMTWLTPRISHSKWSTK